MRKNAGFLVLAMLTLLGGCQAIFTFSPLSGLQRDPADMSPEQRLNYAHEALASGDHDAMLAAYNAILGDTSADAQYTAAQLGIELSGVPTLLLEIADDTSTLTAQLDDIDTFITSHGLDPAYLVAASAQLDNAQTDGATLTTMDYVLGSMGSLLGAATVGWDITTVPPGSGAAAQADLAPALANVASLAADDPLRMLVEEYNTYLGTLP